MLILLAAVLRLTIKRALVVEWENQWRVAVDAGFAQVRRVDVTLTSDVDDDACDACIRLTERLLLLVGAAGQLRDRIHERAAFDAGPPAGQDVKRNLFSVVIGYRKISRPVK